MTQQNMIENLKQNMPEGLTELEQARYIYINLGKQKAFDTRYFYGNQKTKQKIYRLSEEAKRNPDKFQGSKNIICVSLSYAYQNVLREFGIDCDVALDEEFSDGHLTPIVKLSDGRRLKADLQLDLPNIQAGLETEQFGTDFSGFFCNTIGKNELKEIDQKVGYIGEDYKDKAIEELTEEIQEMGAADMLEHILQSPKIYEGIKFQGHVERRRYFNFVLNRLAKEYINKKIYMFTCYREKEGEDGKEKDYTLCAYSYEKEKVKPYLYSEKEERFVPVSLEKLAELQDEGLVLGTREHTNGVQLLNKAIQKNVRESIDKTR